MDNKDIKGPEDQRRINIHEAYEVRYWTHTLGISRERLKEVVEKVGPSTDAVRKELAA